MGYEGGTAPRIDSLQNMRGSINKATEDPLKVEARRNCKHFRSIYYQRKTGQCNRLVPSKVGVGEGKTTDESIKLG